LEKNGARFITRINEDSRHKVLESQTISESLIVGNLTIHSDEKVYLIRDKEIFYTPFRLIKTTNNKKETIWFLTTEFELTISEVIFLYKRRWDIEVFFRFIKQELNFKHFISTNINGIKVILYMTLILAMLILMYKKFNEVGYKTAKRRFYYELDDLILHMAIIMSGGNPRLVLRC
jgi:IS4 transposase